MIDSEPWNDMEHEEDLEDFSEDSMESISEIFFHHFLEVGWVEEVVGDEQISEMISRSG